MKDRRALTLAPLAIFPVALVFVGLRSWWIGDLRELFAAPLSAAAITAVGYPIAVIACWVVARAVPKVGRLPLGADLAIGAATAEAAFWLLVHPWWQREFSNAFCVVLVAACGLATAAAFCRLRAGR